MKDKKTESDIKLMSGFLEYWVKFHSIYEETLAKEIITKDDEEKFLENKNSICGKYDNLKNALDYRYVPRGRLTDPVVEILSLQTMRFISEESIKKTSKDWKDSYIFLNNIFERLKTKKNRMEVFSPFGVFFKRFRERIQKRREGEL